MTRWIHGLSRELLRASFCEYFGLGPEYVDILVVLYERPHENVQTRRLRYLLNSHRPPSFGVVYERIRVLREVMEAESIDSGGQLDATGYKLTEVGYLECQKALLHMADVLMKHGNASEREIRALSDGARLALPPPTDPDEGSALRTAGQARN